MRRASTLVFLVVTLVLMGVSVTARAEFPLTILKTRHLSAEVIAPKLAPLVSPGGRVSGINDTLLIRTDAANLVELRAALEAIDRPAQRLRIRVRSALDARETHRDLGVGGELGNDDVRIRLPDTPDRRNTEIQIGSARIGGSVGSSSLRQGGEQFVDTLDGGRASLFLGTSVPLPFRQVFIRPDGTRVVRGTTYRDVGSGVIAEPEVHGSRVRVVISPERSQMDARGRAQVFRLETEVEGRLGEWMPVGGAEQTTDDRGIEIGRTSNASRASGAVFWLRVDPLDSP
ncbi:hypothetical protein G3580_08835 [Nitrogeniibacter mangrovi]|uniref:NolW-like domain-containing protein n=1 Tax=Nitrogeniibacter mangrovi TaxID=2016596 RepID=A0A6C1B279_9RHOO|nr:hypothetical protein [Nitrogeniibacter mangrovi]QID17742.1 hypothetical protein G3580_08835 [Nitrogeniibacter mangrovi]